MTNANLYILLFLSSTIYTKLDELTLLTKASRWPLGDQTRVGLTSILGASSRRAQLVALTANKLFLALLPRIWRAVNASILGFLGCGRSGAVKAQKQAD